MQFNVLFARIRMCVPITHNFSSNHIKSDLQGVVTGVKQLTTIAIQVVLFKTQINMNDSMKQHNVNCTAAKSNQREFAQTEPELSNSNDKGEFWKASSTFAMVLMTYS